MSNKEKRRNQTRSRQGQAQEFVIWTGTYFYELRITQGYQLDHLLSLRVLNLSVIMPYLNMVDYLMFFLLMSTWIFCAEQVEGVILLTFLFEFPC